MDVITLARELGKAIQREESYIALEKARIESDQDMELQNLIGEFNLKRMQINNEAMKDDRDENKLMELNAALKATYQAINENEHMQAYNVARVELDNLLRRVNTIVNQSAEGADPETVDYEENACSGSCSSCSGCG